ncbi:TCAM1 protein, partial [Crypturellus undulatus]|nr:TCAM1 protein [Crypturellus undulatus]
MTPSAEVRPSFEDVFNILSQIPEDKLLNLKHKLKRLVSKPCSKVLQAMVLHTLRQEAEARICLDALRDERAALHVLRTRLDPAGARRDGEDPAPPELDAEAMVLLARIYALLAEENLCGREAAARAYRRVLDACGAGGDPRQESLRSILEEAREKCGAALGFPGSGSRFQTLRSELGIAGGAGAAARSSPVPIGSAAELPGPRSLRSSGSPASFVSRFEISESPTVALRSPSPRDGPSPLPAQGAAASRHPSRPGAGIPSPAGSATNRPVESSDVSSVGPPEPPAPEAPKGEDSPGSAPDAGAAAQPAPIHPPAQDAAARTPLHAPSAPSASSLSPHPSSFSSAPPKFPYPHSADFPAACPAPAQAAGADGASEADGGERRFFTFVVLHASSDVATALRVQSLLEGMGVPEGATFSGDFLTGGRGQLSCFQDAMENSAFTILLLTKNFLCQPCMFQTNSALMQSIETPSKYNSVIPFVPRENPLEDSEIPLFLRGLVSLNENSPLFPTRVRNTFTRSKVSEQRALWKRRQQLQEQRRKLQLYQEHSDTLSRFSNLNLGSLPQAPWAA